MFYTGARPSELKNLKRDHINFKNKDIIFYSAKGNKDRIVPFLNNILYNDMKKHCESLTRENVFSVTYNQLVSIFNDIKRRENIADHEVVEPRTMRISFAKYCLSKGMRLTELKDLMGHEDIRVTEMYARADYHSIKEICEKIRIGFKNLIDPLKEAYDKIKNFETVIKNLNNTIKELNKTIKLLQKEK